MNTLRIVAHLEDSYLGPLYKETRMTVDCHGMRVGMSQVLHDTELVSYFDQMWERVGIELKARLKELGCGTSNRN